MLCTSCRNGFSTASNFIEGDDQCVRVELLILVGLFSNCRNFQEDTFRMGIQPSLTRRHVWRICETLNGRALFSKCCNFRQVTFRMATQSTLTRRHIWRGSKTSNGRTHSRPDGIYRILCGSKKCCKEE